MKKILSIKWSSITYIIQHTLFGRSIYREAQYVACKGTRINSWKIFTAKPHEKIPPRTLGLDVKKLLLIPEKHIMKKYTVLKWFKKRYNGHICDHDYLCVLQMQGISSHAE